MNQSINQSIKQTNIRTKNKYINLINQSINNISKQLSIQSIIQQIKQYITNFMIFEPSKIVQKFEIQSSLVRGTQIFAGGGDGVMIFDSSTESPYN